MTRCSYGCVIFSGLTSESNSSPVRCFSKAAGAPHIRVLCECVGVRTSASLAGINACAFVISSRMRHLLRLNQRIKLLTRKMLQLQRRLAQTRMLDMSHVRNLRRLVISHLRSKRRNQHERILNVEVYLGAIDLNALDHVFHIAMTRSEERRV